MMVNLANSPKPTVVFFGNERLATGVTTTAPTLSALIKEGYTIEAVIVNHQQARSRKERVLEVEKLAQEHDIPVLKPESREALVECVAALSSPIAVLVAYGRIIPKQVIDHFKHGIVNVHPSKLPLYRGSTPLESAILDGADSTAVSLMALDVKMDAGAVYAQKDVLIHLRTSKQELTDQAGQIGAELIINYLPKIISQALRPEPQDDSLATYTRQIDKADGKLDFTKTASELERQIRAFAGWPGSHMQLAGKDVVVTGADSIDESGTPGTTFIYDHQPAVYCSQQALVITSLKPAGKNQMSGADFLRGNPI